MFARETIRLALTRPSPITNWATLTNTAESQEFFRFWKQYTTIRIDFNVFNIEQHQNSRAILVAKTENPFLTAAMRFMYLIVQHVVGPIRKGHKRGAVYNGKFRIRFCWIHADAWHVIMHCSTMVWSHGTSATSYIGGHINHVLSGGDTMIFEGIECTMKSGGELHREGACRASIACSIKVSNFMKFVLTAGSHCSCEPFQIEQTGVVSGHATTRQRQYN